MKADRLIGLEGLRGVAALCVLAFHSAMIATGFTLSNAYLAVDFFFMLSGFVMARTYERRFGEGLAAFGFLWGRLRRLWPPMALGGLIGIPLLASRLGGALAGNWGIVAALNLMLIPTPIGNVVFPLNGPAWSIFFELFANCLHVLVLRRLPTRGLALLVAGLVPLALLVMPPASLDVGAHPESFLLGVPRVLLPYGMGMLVWRVWGDRPMLWMSPGFTFGAMPLLFGASALLHASSLRFDMVFVVVVCPLLLAGGLAYAGHSPLARLLGAISFPLYAVHLPILELADAHGLGVGAGIALSLGVAGLLAFAPRIRVRAFAAWQRRHQRPLLGIGDARL